MKTTKIFDVTEKARIYHTLAQMSSSFCSILRYCADLEQAGALTSKSKRRFQAFTVEVQGELNLAILEHMDGIELEDWARGGDVRDKWEKYLRGEPNGPAERSPQKDKDPALKRELGLVLQQKRLPEAVCSGQFEYDRPRDCPSFCMAHHLIRRLMFTSVYKRSSRKKDLAS